VTDTLVRSSFQEKYVDVDGFAIRYLEAGSGPPLVWMHSAGGLRPSRAHQLLADKYRVIAFEAPGYAPGQPNERSQSLADLGSILVNAANALGLARFNLWGTSFGGALALWTTIAFPESVEMLILEGPGAIQPPDGFPEVRTPAELHQYLHAHPERHTPAPELEPGLRDQRRALLQRVNSESRADVEARMAEVNAPTLVIFGTSDRLTPPELGRIYREKMPRCHLVLLYDASHDAAGDRPEAFASLVSDFLERGEAFIVTQKSSLLNP
jgi:pimeloyl-ACP methyl ester carboxylesterase